MSIENSPEFIAAIEEFNKMNSSIEFPQLDSNDTTSQNDLLYVARMFFTLGQGAGINYANAKLEHEHFLRNRLNANNS
jgi:hypothetical protein